MTVNVDYALVPGDHKTRSSSGKWGESQEECQKTLFFQGTLIGVTDD